MKLRNSKTWTKTTTYNLPKPHAFSPKAPHFPPKAGGFLSNTSKTAAVLPAKSRGEPRKTLSDKPLEYVQNAAENAHSL